LRALFADQNKNAGSKRDEVDQENGGAKGQSKSEQAMQDQINREQKHADVFCDFHVADCWDRLPADNSNFKSATHCHRMNVAMHPARR